MSLFIGLISGTSADAIDAALVSFDGNDYQLEHYQEFPYPPEITKQISSIRSSVASMPLAQLSGLNVKLGYLFAGAVNRLLKNAKVSPDQIKAIGSHGQTIYHLPDGLHPFSLQIGDPNTIAAVTSINTVADFRNMDMAMGGQGAPLACGFHQAIFRSPEKSRVILNLGGIANITLLPSQKTKAITGFDTGPASALMDEWTTQHLNKPFDRDGKWGKTGKVISQLLDRMLVDQYFLTQAPKSTGREYFNLEWLQSYLHKSSFAAEDIQATLQRLTVESIARAIENEAGAHDELIICGGGAHNTYLLELLIMRLSNIEVNISSKYNIKPDCVEAMAFAWLAKRRLENLPGNVPTVTGAKKEVVLGAIYSAK